MRVRSIIRSAPLRVMMAVISLAFVSLFSAEASAVVSASNNFGSSTTYPGIYLNDGNVAEWSTWWGYVPGWNATRRDAFKTMQRAAFEYFEATDLTITEGPDNTKQDVRVVPTDTGSMDIAITECIIGAAVIYGSDHHKVCDYKQITTFSGAYSQPLQVQVWNVLGHEFGHEVGLRHSNAPCPMLNAACIGTSATGASQWNTHNAPGTDSFMWQGLSTPAAITLNLQDLANIQDHY